jgi:glycosyltransferase involved in cell wall biosynthesis
MFLSIVIPTIGRKSELKSLLSSLYQMNSSNFTFEVIVINQNPIGYLDEILVDYINRDSFKIFNVDFKGLSKAKNYGVEKSIGDFVTFPDDDCRVMTDTYYTSVNLISSLGLDIISGKCIDNNGKDSVQIFKNENFYLRKNDFEGGFIEATCVIKKEIFRKFQYDENLGAGTFFGAHEGYDWIFRVLSEKIFKVYYSQNIIFYHPQVVLNKGNYDSLRRVNSYSYGFVYSRLKHKKYFEVIKRLALSFLLIFYYLPFSFLKSNYYLVEFLSILLAIPLTKSLRQNQI